MLLKSGKNKVLMLLMLLGIASKSLLLAQTALAASASVPAADFALKSRSGENVRLSELRGQVVMVNFWASWCGPCRQEMPLLDDIYQKYNKMGFTLLGVNIDEDPAMADKILKDIPVSFPILLDSKNSVSELYGVDAMPTTILVDRDGNKRFLHRGFKAGYEKSYEEQVKNLIRER
jgi:thiol-disulfide isomerase/thioredoxin